MIIVLSTSGLNFLHGYRAFVYGGNTEDCFVHERKMVVFIFSVVDQRLRVGFSGEAGEGP
jgi:hypothetical protein